ELAPGLPQTRMSRISVDIQEGRVAIVEDRRRRAGVLENARRDALELRADFLEQKRFEEASRLLMLSVGASVRLGEIEEAGDLAVSATDEELLAPTGAEVLAGAALRCGQPRKAAEMIEQAPGSTAKDRIRAYAKAQFGGSPQIEAAVAELESIAQR